MSCPTVAGPCPLKPPVHLSKILSVSTRPICQTLGREIRIRGDLVNKGPKFRITKLSCMLDQMGTIPLDHLVVEAWPVDILRVYYYPDSIEARPSGSLFLLPLIRLEYDKVPSMSTPGHPDPPIWQYFGRVLWKSTKASGSTTFTRNGLLEITIAISSDEVRIQKSKHSTITLV
jgi:hypothetical protein